LLTFKVSRLVDQPLAWW